MNLEDLIVQHRKRVLNHCARRGLNPDDAADIAQEVFIKVMRNLNRYEARCSITTWLYRITENAIIDHLRHRANRPERVEATRAGEESLMNLAAPLGNPEQAQNMTEVCEHLALAMERMPGKLRQALELREFEGWSYEEIAQQANCSREAVKTRIHRARKFLIQRLAHLR